MKNIILTSILIIYASLPVYGVEKQKSLYVYPAPVEAKLNDAFTVEVRQDCMSWQAVPVYNVMVDKVGTSHEVLDSSMAYFDFSSYVDVRVISNSQHIESARIRPSSYDILSEISNDTLMFTLDRPRLLSIEVNGDIFNNLQLFANPVDTNRPDDIRKFAEDKNNLYFGPGYHKLDEVMVVGSGRNIYIDGGAYIDGMLEVADANDVSIHGRGMIYPCRK